MDIVNSIRKWIDIDINIIKILDIKNNNLIASI